MRERVLKDGEVLFRIGDRSEEIFIVNSGRIVLRSLDENGEVRDEIKTEGALFGADELLGGLSRTAQAIAMGPAELAAFSPAEISEALATQRGYAAAHAVEAEIVTLEPGRPDSAVTGSVSIIAASEPLADQMGGAPMLVERFPYVVGRREKAEEQALDLALADERPYHLSRRHFMLDQRRGHFSICDCGSHHGTIIDGDVLGAGEPEFRRILDPGEHEIIAGRNVSPFRFVCRIP